MRKQLVFMLLFSLIFTTSNVHALLEIPAILGFSWAALNTAATCCLCCSRCQDKRQTANQDSRLASLEKDSKRLTTVLDNMQVRIIENLLGPEDSENNIHLRASLKTAEHRISLEKSKRSENKATNTDLMLITLPQLPTQSRRSLDRKLPTSPSECQ